MFSVLLLVTICFLNNCTSVVCLVCKDVHCFGSMQELSEVSEQSHMGVVYHVKPDNFTSLLSEKQCLDQLMRSQLLDCESESSSYLDDYHPWTIPVSVSLQPSCSGIQNLVRTSLPSEDDMNDLDMAQLVVSDKETACSVLKITESHVAISNFEVDNNRCVSTMSDSHRNSYSSSVINLYPRQRNITNVTLSNIATTGGEISVHISSLSKRFPILMTSDIVLYNVTGGTVFLEMTCGDISLHGCKAVHKVAPGNLCPSTPTSDMGPMEQILLYNSLTHSSQARGDCVKCHIALAVAILLSLLLSILSCVCFFANHTMPDQMFEDHLMRRPSPLENVGRGGKVFSKRHVQ